MASDSKQTALTIRILGRDYAVACPADERESLLRSAEHLSKRMSAIQRHGKTFGTERVAVIAALNITRDLLDLRRQVDHHNAEAADDAGDLRERLAQLQQRIESALDDAD